MFLRLALLFVLVPLVELALLIQVGRWMGVLPTVALVVLTGILGAALARYQGLVTLARFRTALAEGRLPHRELVEGILILLAGAVLLTPGLLTDVTGFLLLVPPLRGAVAKRIEGWASRRIEVRTGSGPSRRSGRAVRPESPRQRRARGKPPTEQWRAEVLDVEFRVEDGKWVEEGEAGEAVEEEGGEENRNGEGGP